MRARTIIAVLLIIAMMTTTTARARTLAPLIDPPVETKETPLTLDEELEARAVAEQFVRRFEGSDDLLSIVDDLYVSDFNDRLRNDVADRFIIPIASDLALQAKGDELRRCHIATLKFIYLYILIGAAWYSVNNLDGDARQEESDKEFNPLEALPTRVVAVLKDDPAFAEMILEASKNRSKANGEVEGQAIAEGAEKKVKDADVTIKDMERLRSYVSILEQAVAIMREHLETLPAPHTWQGLLDLMHALGQEPSGEPVRPRVITLIYDYFGCPKGTRLICINVMDFHMELVRVDGQLRILSVNMGEDC